MKQEKEESKRGKQKFSRRDIPGWSPIHAVSNPLPAELSWFDFPSHFMCHFVEKFTLARDMFVGSAFQFGFLSCQEFTYI